MKVIRFLPLLFLCVSVHVHDLWANSNKFFKVGVLLCLTGDCAEWGDNSLKGIRLAVEEINAEGGVLGREVTLVVQDTREGGNGANAVTAYNSLVLDPEIHYIIGPTWSVGGLPLAPLVAKRADMIITSPSLGVAEFNETADNIFNTWPHDAIATEALAEYAIAHAWKKIAIFSGNDPWVATQGDVFEKEYKSLGGTVSIKIETNPGQRDLKIEALKIKSTGPDAVFYSNTYSLALMAKELRRLNYTGKQIAIQMDDTRVKEAQGTLENTVFAMFPESSSTFRQLFEKEYSNKPGVTADTAYDTLMIYADAIRRAGTFDIPVVQRKLLETNYEGAAGTVKFDTQGGVVRSPVMWLVKDSKFVLAESGL